MAGRKVFKCKTCYAVLMYKFDYEDHKRATAHLDYEEVWI
jgi:hypothetical protein